MARKVSLTVNNVSINLDAFVENFVFHVTGGIVASLKNTGAINKMDLDVEDTGDIKMVLNGNDIPLNYFATEIIRNTLAGMVSNLKGVEGKMKTLELKINQ